jgi:hypothetical protein
MTRNEINCPRAKTWMTPCIARDGNTALADPPQPVCVGCGEDPHQLLAQLAERYPAAGGGQPQDPDAAADRLTECVAAYVGAKA